MRMILIGFQHTAARRQLLSINHVKLLELWFQHTAARRWLHFTLIQIFDNVMFQHTATRRWLPGNYNYIELRFKVSTHSHPKVAADRHNDSIRHKQFQHTATRRWLLYAANNITFTAEAAFQHTATRRWLHGVQYYALTMIAGFNTQPPEGGCTGIFITIHHDFAVSTHSHPKVAAKHQRDVGERNRGFNTQPPEGGCVAI